MYVLNPPGGFIAFPNDRKGKGLVTSCVKHLECVLVIMYNMNINALLEDSIPNYSCFMSSFLCIYNQEFRECKFKTEVEKLYPRLLAFFLVV